MKKIKGIRHERNVFLIVLVASLGYFVDIYDLVVFSIVRVQSFQSLGVPLEKMRVGGEYVLNMQMGGLLIGGMIWGIIGDKYGRLKVLFGSILLYSIANISNAFVYDLHSYAIIRFVAGIGLAGELGAGVTLVNESMHKNKRGYGTMLIASIGVLGALAAFYVAEYFEWRKAYIVGGIMGFVLLFLRLGIFESSMYIHSEKHNVPKGKLSMLFTKKERFLRYLYCLLIGLPIWFIVGIFVTLAPEFGTALKAPETLSAGKGILYCYLGISIGDIFAGLIAQISKSRRLAVLIFIIGIVVSSSIYLNSIGITPAKFHSLAFFMGLSVGYWATFVTIASEQFGTNLRSTVTTTAPNFVRGALIPSTLLFEIIITKSDIITAGFFMIIGLSIIALFALSRLKESFNVDLNFLEQD